MKRAVVAAVALSVAASVSAQERQHRGSQRPTVEVVPPSRIVPPVLSTRLPTILPPPPPASPFAARPDTYAPRFDQQAPFRAGPGNGVSIYNGTLGFFPYAAPAAPPAADRTPAPAPATPAPVPEPPRAPEPPKAKEPAQEPPKIAVVQGPDLFYVIPGCYAGNRPPTPERLPKGCDLAKLRTLPIR